MNRFDEDIRVYERALKYKKWRNLLIILVILWFVALFVVAMMISQRQVTFATEAYGYDVLEPGKPSQMKFQVFDLAKRTLIDDFKVKVQLKDERRNQAWTVIDGHSAGRTTMVADYDVPGALPEGKYTLQFEYNCAYGKEITERPIEIKKTIRTMKVSMEDIPANTWKKPEAVQVTDFGEPYFNVELLPENGRVATGLKQRFFIIARTRLGDPIQGLRVMVRPAGKQKVVADVLTDGAGLGEFMYTVPLGATSMDMTIVKLDEKDAKALAALKKKIAETKSKKRRRKMKLPAPNPKKQQIISKTAALGPMGTNVHAIPTEMIIDKKKPAVTVQLSTLTMGNDLFIDAYRYGMWITHWQNTPKAEVVKLAFPLPKGTTGVVQFQVADDIQQVGERYDAFLVYLSGLKDPFKRMSALYDLLGKKSRNFDETGVAAWRGWVEKVTQASEEFDPNMLVRAGMSMIQKPYYLPPLLYNNRDEKMAAHQAEMKKYRGMITNAMMLSGLLVLLVILGLIVRELRARGRLVQEMELEDVEDEEAVDAAVSIHKGRAVSYTIILLILAIGYGAMVYFVNNLSWGTTWIP